MSTPGDDRTDNDDDFALSERWALASAAVGFVGAAVAALVVHHVLGQELPETLPDLIDAALPVAAPVVGFFALLDLLLMNTVDSAETFEEVKQATKYRTARRITRSLWKVIPLAAGLGYAMVAVDPDLDLSGFLMAAALVVLGIIGLVVASRGFETALFGAIAAFGAGLAVFLWSGIPSNDVAAFECYYLTDSRGSLMQDAACVPTDEEQRDGLPDGLMGCLAYAREVSTDRMVTCAADS